MRREGISRKILIGGLACARGRGISKADVLVDAAGVVGGICGALCRAGYALKPLFPSRTSSAKRTSGCACQRCRPAWAKGHATTARRDLNRLPPQHRRLAERGYGVGFDLARA